MVAIQESKGEKIFYEGPQIMTVKRSSFFSKTVNWKCFGKITTILKFAPVLKTVKSFFFSKFTYFNVAAANGNCKIFNLK